MGAQRSRSITVRPHLPVKRFRLHVRARDESPRRCDPVRYAKLVTTIGHHARKAAGGPQARWRHQGCSAGACGSWIVRRSKTSSNGRSRSSSSRRARGPRAASALANTSRCSSGSQQGHPACAASCKRRAMGRWTARFQSARARATAPGHRHERSYREICLAAATESPSISGTLLWLSARRGRAARTAAGGLRAIVLSDHRHADDDRTRLVVLPASGTLLRLTVWVRLTGTGGAPWELRDVSEPAEERRPVRPPLSRERGGCRRASRRSRRPAAAGRT